ALQPPDRPDIRPHFIYYLNSPFCDPIKFTESGSIAGISAMVYHGKIVWLAHIIVQPEQMNKGIKALENDNAGSC
ncbi:MAG TPA: hypothetical protein PKA90_13645, partial [Ignavibacteria bacterium]|nr:hypothetical protein [Ignavibacteria bacterium]